MFGGQQQPSGLFGNANQGQKPAQSMFPNNNLMSTPMGTGGGGLFSNISNPNATKPVFGQNPGQGMNPAQGGMQPAGINPGLGGMQNTGMMMQQGAGSNMGQQRQQPTYAMNPSGGQGGFVGFQGFASGTQMNPHNELEAVLDCYKKSYQEQSLDSRF